MEQIKFLFSLVMFLLLPNNITFATNTTQQLSINFDNIKTRDLLHLLAKSSKKNVLINENINNKISINLHKISWREALDIVLQMQNLTKQETANAIVISPKGENNKNEHHPSQPATFNLHHTSADEVSKILKPTGMLSPSGKAGAETRTNMLVVADTDDKIEDLKALLKQIDVPVKQVLIEARIVSADEIFARDLGLEFGMTKPKETNKSSKQAIDSQRQKFSFAIAKLNNSALLDLELAALESEGRGKVISSPKLLTADRQAAYIESGSEIPYQEKTKEGNTSIAFKKAVLSLKVTPEVVDENSINLLLQLNQDKVSQLTINGVPAIDTRKIQTQVLAQNGETIVLGGIYEWAKSNHIVGIPFLRNIPLFGVLFRRQENRTERRELLMFVTPKIVN